MWKDFFYFSKSQRNGIIVLIILIITVILSNYLLPCLFPPVANTDDTAFMKEVESFKRSLLSRDSLKQLEKSKSSFYWETEQSDVIPSEYTLFTFNPNIADAVTFIKLGISTEIARRIIRYRDKGGVFKTADDFNKIYGLSVEKFNELKPYIKIEKIKLLLVDLNLADTAELMKVHGIGSYYAKEIVSFRNRAGGFYSVEQLREIRNMRKENYERMKDCCSVDLSLINKIDINKASLTRLKKHPYITDDQAKAIVDLRKERKLTSLDDLMETGYFSQEELVRLTPYLNFDGMKKEPEGS